MTSIQKDVLRYIEDNFAVRSPELAKQFGLDLHKIQLLLADLSSQNLIKRSNSGLYRIREYARDLNG